MKEENAKWLLNIQWQMTGVDVHADSNIGKHLSALARYFLPFRCIKKLLKFVLTYRTLTALTGEEEDDQQVIPLYFFLHSAILFQDCNNLSKQRSLIQK